MNIINKADKYGEENEDYQLMIGDNDIILSRKGQGQVFHFNFASGTLVFREETE